MAEGVGVGWGVVLVKDFQVAGGGVAAVAGFHLGRDFEVIGTAMEVAAEVLDSVNVGANCGLGEVATPQLLNH